MRQDIKRRRATRVLAALAAGSLVLAACGGDDDDDSSATTAAGAEATTAGTAATETTAGEEPAETAATETTAGEESTETTAGEVEAEAWIVDTELCVDPDAAEAPIEGTIKIGSVMPLTGGPATLFAPVSEGLRAYIDYANENQLLGDVAIELSIEDDQYSKDLTPAAVAKLVGEGVNLFTGIIGTANNAAVRDTLNDECIPQINNLTGSPAWGDVEAYPWTNGALVPYDVETKIYAEHMKTVFPSGATAALFYINSEFGQIYADTVHEIADEYSIDVVDEQTVNDGDPPPTSQLTSIASKQPQVIFAVPLGLGCKAFFDELAAKKAENPGWEPVVYVTNTCGSNSFFLNLIGAPADGLISAAPLKDVVDPKNAADPGVKAYVDAMTARGKADQAADGAAGWAVGETTVAILKQAMESEAGLTRASIIEAARHVEFTGSLGREGIVYRSMGIEDPFPAQSLQVVQWDAETKTFTDLGPVNSSFES